MATAIFVIASAALALLTLGYVLRPLWHTRPRAALGVVAMLALVTGLTYGLVGTPRALDPVQRRSPASLTEAIDRLEAELKRDPSQSEGWRLLARAYTAEGRRGDARDALARAATLSPDDPDLLVEAAEARALANADRSIDAEAVALLRRALALQPASQRARWFLGISQRQAGQPAEAAQTWEPLLAVVDPGTAAGLREQIDAARNDAGLPPLPAAAPAVAAAPAIAGPGIQVSVSLDPALGMRLPEGATLFVIARRPGGAPIPVAVEKTAANRFPLVVTLDDNDSLMPTVKLSQLARVELSARISASGEATAQPGDFAATPVLVDAGPDAAGALLIDQVVE